MNNDESKMLGSQYFAFLPTDWRLKEEYIA